MLDLFGVTLSTQYGFIYFKKILKKCGQSLLNCKTQTINNQHLNFRKLEALSIDFFYLLTRLFQNQSRTHRHPGVFYLFKIFLH